MPPSPQGRRPILSLVADRETPPPEPGLRIDARHNLDWSICMALAQSGDRDAYRRLLTEITPYVRSLVVRNLKSRADVEDVVQEILLTVHAVRHTYDPTRPFGPWLVALANRRIVDGLRRHGRIAGREIPLDEENETFSGHGTNYHEGASDGRALHAAVDRLPAGQREAIRLLKLEEMSLQEASASSGMSISALKVATHRAMKNLRRIFEIHDKSA